MLLPQPDSPTSPTVSPGRTSKLTSSTARTAAVRANSPVLTGKCLVRPRTEMTGLRSLWRAAMSAVAPLPCSRRACPAAISRRADAGGAARRYRSGQAAAAVSQTGRRNGQRGAKRQPGSWFGGRGRQPFDGCELAGARAIEPRHRSQQSHGVGMARPVKHRRRRRPVRPRGRNTSRRRDARSARRSRDCG